MPFSQIIIKLGPAWPHHKKQRRAINSSFAECTNCLGRLVMIILLYRLGKSRLFQSCYFLHLDLGVPATVRNKLKPKCQYLFSPKMYILILTGPSSLSTIPRTSFTADKNAPQESLKYKDKHIILGIPERR